MQGGQGDIKHWAFNDPIRREGNYKDAPPSPAEYRALSARMVDLHLVMLAQNARASGGGNITMVPTQAIAVGPLQTWKAEQVSIWQAGTQDNPLGQQLTALMISKRLVDSAVPMSLLADPPNVQFNDFRGGLGSCAVEMHEENVHPTCTRCDASLDVRQRMATISRREFMAGSLGVAGACVAARADEPRGPDVAAKPAALAEPAGPTVIDTHTHFYDPTRPQGVPWPGKGDALLYRPVLPVEWEKLVAPLGVTGTIVVEASPLVEDNQWLLDLAAAHKPRPGMQGIVGIVGRLPLGESGCDGLIARFAKNRLFRGIRVNAQSLFAGLDDNAYLADLERFSELGLTLDVNGSPMNGAFDRLARRLPGLRIVVEHMGSGRFAESGPEEAWRDAIATAARHPNVFLKVSALIESAAHAAGRPNGRTDAAFYEPWLECVWEAFGMKRLCFGSNWPVSARAGSYADVLGIVRPFFAAKGREAERWFFADASRAAYRWSD